MGKTTIFIKNSGGCIVSNNILTKKGKIKWCFREKPLNGKDNGWRFLSDIDDDEYINEPDNLRVCDFNYIANIEPAILEIYMSEVGTELELVDTNGKKSFINCKTGKTIDNHL